MILHRVRLLNFRQHERTELELGPGMLAVVGPNGAGKTTLLEAIAWALYGTAAARGNRDSIKRRGAPARARVEVELEFALGNHEYRVNRTLTAAELTQDGQVLANSTVSVTERVVALLGMNREEFFSTYFTGQKELSVMASMTPTERSKFLSRVLGYEKLRTAQDKLRERRTARRNALAGLEQGLADPAEIEGAVNAATAALADARARRDRAEKGAVAARESLSALDPTWLDATERRTAWQGLDGERRLAESRVASRRAAFQALDNELAQASSARNRLATMSDLIAEWDPLCQERDRLDAAAAEAAVRSRSLARRDEARTRLDAIDTERANLPDEAVTAALREKRVIAQAGRDEADRLLAERRTRWTQDAQEARTKLESFRDQFKELRDQRTALEEAGAAGICPTCGRPLGKDHPATLALLGRQMEDVQASGNYYRQRVEQLESPPPEVRELEQARQVADEALARAVGALQEAESQLRRRVSLTAERDRLEVEITDLTARLGVVAGDYDPARHAAVRARITELEPRRREHDQLVGLAARAEMLVADAARAEHEATEAEQALAELDRRLAELAWDPTEFVALEKRIQLARSAVEETRVAVARAEAEVSGAEKLREVNLERQADRTAKAKAVRELTSEVERLTELDGAFVELRTILNQQLRPELRDRTAVFLSELTRGRYTDLELTEDYVAVLVENGELKPVISGGEEDVLNLALRLAISQMIAERAGQPLSLLVLDEILGSLDEERRQSVVDLLRAVADRFPQVILISHVEGLADSFDRVVRISHDHESGITAVREETPELAGVAD